jgi:hypothetical protein
VSESENWSAFGSLSAIESDLAIASASESAFGLQSVIAKVSEFEFA